MEQMRQALGVVKKTFGILKDELLVFAACNALWFLLCVPVVTAPAAFAGLYYVADLAARDRPARIMDFFVGFRQYFVKGSLLGLLNVLVGAVIVANVLFYGQMQAGWTDVVQAVWLGLGVLWAIFQIYLLPMLVVQVQPSVWGAIRNGVLLCASQPLFTLTLCVLSGIVLTISVLAVMPMMIIGIALVALFGCVGLNDRLDRLGIRKQAGGETPTR